MGKLPGKPALSVGHPSSSSRAGFAYVTRGRGHKSKGLVFREKIGILEATCATHWHRSVISLTQSAERRKRASPVDLARTRAPAALEKLYEELSQTAPCDNCRSDSAAKAAESSVQEAYWSHHTGASSAAAGRRPPSQTESFSFHEALRHLFYRGLTI